jgi:high-affinity iron transporter
VVVLANALIGLREGLEASLIVSILLAYLVRSGHTHRRASLWAGVGVAVLVSLLAGGALTLTATELPDGVEPVFAATTSILAVALVTWMVFWMRRASRSISGELRGRLDDALAVGAGAVFMTGFVATAREGLETAVFLWTTARASGDTGVGPAVGAALGIAVAVLLGWLLYRKAVQIDLGRFFRWTGVALIVVAAGVLAYAVHDLQEAGVLPGGDTLMFDVSGTVSPSSPLAEVVHGVLNLTPAMTVLQVLAWLGYLVATMTAFLRRQPAQTLAQVDVAAQ